MTSEKLLTLLELVAQLQQQGQDLIEWLSICDRRA